FGGYRRQLQVVVNRTKLAAYGLSILDVKNAIDRNNVSRPAGNLVTAAREAIVRVDTRATRAEDVLDYPLAAFGRSGVQAFGRSGGSILGGGGGAMGGMGGSETSESPSLNARTPERLNAASGASIVYVRDVARVIDTHWER